MFKKRRSLFQKTVSAGSSFSKKRPLRKGRAVGALMLTSLIDAFSILVVYLLMFFSDTAELTYVNTGIELPKASGIERLDRYFILSVKKEGYFVENRKLDSENLVSYLLDLKKQLNRSKINYDSKEHEKTITIQADKSIAYKELSPLIQACGHVGFSHIKFAVLGE